MKILYLMIVTTLMVPLVGCSEIASSTPENTSSSEKDKVIKETTREIKAEQQTKGKEDQTKEVKQKEKESDMKQSGIQDQTEPKAPEKHKKKKPQQKSPEKPEKDVPQQKDAETTQLNKKSTNTPSKQKTQEEKIDLDYFKSNLTDQTTKNDVIGLFGNSYEKVRGAQNGRIYWKYNFKNDPNYKVVTVFGDAVDTEGILTDKLAYQLFIDWGDDNTIRSYTVYYNDNGKIGELDGKFFEGRYENE